MLYFDDFVTITIVKLSDLRNHTPLITFNHPKLENVAFNVVLQNRMVSTCTYPLLP